MITAGLLATLIICQQPVKADRLDMGIRLKALDTAWLSASPELKKKAVPQISTAVMSFFGGDFSTVTKNLDRARATLESRDVRPGDALIFRVRPAIYAPGEDVEITLGWAYPVDKEVKVKWEGHTWDIKPGEVQVAKVKTQVRYRVMIFPPPIESVRNTESVLVDGVACGSGSVWMEGAEKWAKFEIFEKESNGLALLAPFFSDARKNGHESVFEIADRAARWISTGPRLDGEEDISPLYVTHGNTVIRLAFKGDKIIFDQPKNSPLQGKRKVLIVLHGAGGSENMFPESYGGGKFVDQASSDGWLVLSPRATGSAVKDCLDWLKTRDIEVEKLVIAGHSMGGALALTAANSGVKPDALLLFAPAGGKLPTGIPTFVAVGASEMAMLKGSVEKLGASATQFNTYENAEHLMVVAEAWPDAWAFANKHTQ